MAVCPAWGAGTRDGSTSWRSRSPSRRPYSAHRFQTRFRHLGEMDRLESEIQEGRAKATDRSIAQPSHPLLADLAGQRPQHLIGDEAAQREHRAGHGPHAPGGDARLLLHQRPDGGQALDRAAQAIEISRDEDVPQRDLGPTRPGHAAVATQPRRPDLDDAVIGKPVAQPCQQALMRRVRVLARRRDGIHLDATRPWNAHHLVEAAAVEILDVRGGMRRDALVQTGPRGRGTGGRAAGRTASTDRR